MSGYAHYTIPVRYSTILVGRMVMVSRVLKRLAALPRIPAADLPKRYMIGGAAIIIALSVMAAATPLLDVILLMLVGASSYDPSNGGVRADPAIVFAVAVAILFAIVVSTFCLLVSLLVLLVCLPIYLWSSNEKRSVKAGGLVKSSLGFIIASGAGVLATLGFTT
jgi:hypothetical protein